MFSTGLYPVTIQVLLYLKLLQTFIVVCIKVEGKVAPLLNHKAVKECGA
jgi:hypothetical protein